MTEIQQILGDIEESDKEVIDFMAGMISIPAITPLNGGEGEWKRADYLATFLEGFDTVERYDYEMPKYPGKKRSTLVAEKKGKKPNTIWILSHIDTVPPGSLSDWKSDPFTLVVKDGYLYGRGVEDDGAAVAASVLAARRFLQCKFKGCSLGLILAADEENGSNYGVAKVIESGRFKEGDMFFVPDSATPSNDIIHLAEKSVFWILGKVSGRSGHASAPENSVNPIPISFNVINDLLALENKYNQPDYIFENPVSTFTPTRLEVPPGGVNAIPDYVKFAIDCRLTPNVDADYLARDADSIARKWESRTEAKVSMEYQVTPTGKASPTDSILYKALAESIEEVIGKKVSCGAMSGATCAGYLRTKGFISYGWMMYSGTEHQPNERIALKDVKVLAKVVALLIDKLCV